MIPVALREDAARRPDIFLFNGPILSAPLDDWLGTRKLIVPDDLKEVWQETGGGIIFESETILGPYGNRGLGENVDGENEFHRQKGMPIDWLLFHTGFQLKAVKMSTGEYACLREGSYEVTEMYGSFAGWYAMIRKELASRYGLT
jgi:hypothetical protein